MPWVEFEVHWIDSPLSVDSASALTNSQPVAGFPSGATTVMSLMVIVVTPPHVLDTDTPFTTQLPESPSHD
jgi:hypothetical protein